MRNPFRRKMVVENYLLKGALEKHDQFWENVSSGEIDARRVVHIDSPITSCQYDCYNIDGCGVVIAAQHSGDEYVMQIRFGGIPRAVKSAKRFLEGFLGEIK